MRKSLRECNNREALLLSDRILSLSRISGEVTNLNFDMSDAVFEILEMRSKVLDLLGARDEQKKAIDRLIEISESGMDKHKKARALVLRGKYFIELADYEMALKDGNEVIQIFADRETGSLYCEGLRILGTVYFNLGEFEKALKYFHNRIEISGLIEDQDHYTGSSMTVMANSYNAIGLIYYNMGRCIESARYYEEALKILESTKDKIGMGMTMGNIGLVNWTMGDLESAIRYYDNALKIFSETVYKKGIATIKGNMGAVYIKLGQYREALRFLYEATGIRDEINDRNGLSNDLLNIGLVQRAMHNVGESLALTEKSLVLGREQGNKYMIGTALCELSENFMNIGGGENMKKALGYAQEAYRIGSESKISRIELFALVKIAKIFSAMQMIDEAYDASRKAVSFLETHENAEQFNEEVYYTHSKVLGMLGKKDESLKHLYKAVSVINRVTSRLKNRQFAESFLGNVDLNREILEEKRKLDAEKSKA